VVLTLQKETETKDNSSLKHIHSFHARSLRDTSYGSFIVIILKLEVLEAVRVLSSGSSRHTALQMEMESPPKIMITTYEFTQCHSPEEKNPDRSFNTSEYRFRFTYFHLVNLIHSVHKIGNKPDKMGRYLILQLCYKLKFLTCITAKVQDKETRRKSADTVNV
jgi:hypothetical protein